MCVSSPSGNPYPVRRRVRRSATREVVNFSEGGRVRRSLGKDGSLDIVTAKCKRSSEGSCDTSAAGDPQGCVSGSEHIQPSLADAKPELRYQFERLGYFTLDSDSRPSKLAFNRTITLKDTWAKIENEGKP